MPGIGQKPYVVEYGYYHGYTLLDKAGKTPAYPFGYGLSYTDFVISHLSAARAEGGLKATARVKNTGAVPGAEVVQVYAGSQGAANGDDRPVKLLKAFRRVELAPGEEQEVSFFIPEEELRFYDKGRWVLDDAYTVYVGSSSANARPCPVEAQG